MPCKCIDDAVQVSAVDYARWKRYIAADHGLGSAFVPDLSGILTLLSLSPTRSCLPISPSLCRWLPPGTKEEGLSCWEESIKIAHHGLGQH